MPKFRPGMENDPDGYTPCGLGEPHTNIDRLTVQWGRTTQWNTVMRHDSIIITTATTTTIIITITITITSTLTAITTIATARTITVILADLACGPRTGR